MRKVEIWREVENRIWEKLDEPHRSSVAAELIEELETNYDYHRQYRHPKDERLFVCPVYLPEGDNWHTFEFQVDDATADTHLFVVGVHYEVSKILFPNEE